tara:strand:- start:219 stop:329 length:111 start_codon:yes stop_codon:yes gene_type:complete
MKINFICKNLITGKSAYLRTMREIIMLRIYALKIGQ